MQIKNGLLAGIATVSLVVGGAFAQPTQREHGHDAAKPGAKADTAKQQMTAKELKARLDNGEKVIIIDARHDLAGQIIKGAIHVPIEKLDDWTKDADKNVVIVTYCTCPHDEAADAEVLKLLQMGFKKAYALAGGLDAARAAGIEVVSPSDK